MTAFLPLIVVGLWVIWLRFRLAERVTNASALLLEAVMVELGDKKLANGQRYQRVSTPAAKNRHERRASKHRPF